MKPSIKTFLLDRLREPSTWRGIILILTSAGVAIAPPLMDAIVSTGLLVAGIIGAATPDKRKGT